MPDIHIKFAAIEPDDESAETVVRGMINQDHLRLLNLDWYQREQGFSDKEIFELVELYFARRKLTDITIGMRGNKFTQKGNDFFMVDKLYVIDGGQRLHAALVALRQRPDLKISVGVKIYFNTTAERENEMFCSMNATQRRIAPSVFVRNQYQTSDAAKVLFNLNRDADFALKDRIAWFQNPQPGELITGFQLARITSALHGHLGAVPSGHANEVLAALDVACAQTGADTLRDNIVTFFDVIDECWPIRDVHKKPPALHGTFIVALARLLSGYFEFWDGDALTMATRYRKRLAKFEVEVQLKNLSKSQTSGREVMYELLRRKLQLDPLAERPCRTKADDEADSEAEAGVNA